MGRVSVGLESGYGDMCQTGKLWVNKHLSGVASVLSGH